MATTDTSTGDNRNAGERRGNDRRRLERRTPPPPWRRPWAFAAYGAVGAAILLYTLTGGSAGADDDPPIVDRPPAASAPAPAPVPTPGTNGQVEDAYGGSGFERLTLEGQGAVGRRVRAELYCEPAGSFQVRENVEPEASVAALATNGRVPAASCKWGGASDPRRGDFVLLVPPELADEFASTAVVTDEFQRRRRVPAEVEWIGRSEALALRHVGVLRGLRR